MIEFRISNFAINDLATIFTFCKKVLYLWAQKKYEGTYTVAECSEFNRTINNRF